MHITTISSIVLALLLGFSFAVIWRMFIVNDKVTLKLRELRSRLGDEKEKSQCLHDNLERVLMSNERALMSNECESVTYFVNHIGSSTVVLRRSKVGGREYHTFIKRFNDEDTEFNIREAEELCEILNRR